MWFPWFQKLLRESRKTQEILTQEISAVHEAAEAAEKKQGEIGVAIAGSIERAAASVPEYEKSQRDKEYKLQRKIFRATVVGVVFAAAAAIGAWYYASIAKQQLGEMIKQYPELQKSAQAAKDAATVARDSLTIVQRPWLEVYDEENDATSAARRHGFADSIVRQRPVIFPMDLINSGKTPAKTVRADVFIVILHAREAPPLGWTEHGPAH
jgi:hypothetical protein